MKELLALAEKWESEVGMRGTLKGAKCAQELRAFIAAQEISPTPKHLFAECPHCHINFKVKRLKTMQEIEASRP